MAELLGTAIEAVIKELGGAAAIKTHQQLDDLMNILDGQFTPFYTGWNGTIATATGDIRPSTGGIERQPPLGGTAGFKEEYLDSVNPAEGQTHHFAAYFSAGINGFSGYAKSTAHKVYTDLNNRGDRALGDVAFSFGASLLNRTHLETRLNPLNPKAPTAVIVNDPVSDRLARFRNLASQVRSKICN